MISGNYSERYEEEFVQFENANGVICYCCSAVLNAWQSLTTISLLSSPVRPHCSPLPIRHSASVQGNHDLCS